MLLKYIGDFILDGYKSGYYPHWSLKVTTPREEEDFEWFKQDLKDRIYNMIGYMIKEGHQDNYIDVEFEYEDGKYGYFSYELEY